jgi:hypothetical protein
MISAISFQSTVWRTATAIGVPFTQAGAGLRSLVGVLDIYDITS